MFHIESTEARQQHQVHGESHSLAPRNVDTSANLVIFRHFTEFSWGFHGDFSDFMLVSWDFSWWFNGCPGDLGRS
jgi:hypothetical protein